MPPYPRARPDERGDTEAWISRYGPQLGFRPPSLEDRSRATGTPEYLSNLHLEGRALYDAQGNRCDRHC
eukprot:10354807-Lingulodinium_polyedra.AAC.1